MNKVFAVIAACIMASSVSFAGIEWTKSIADETEALDLVCNVREGGGLVISPVNSLDQFEMLREELGPSGLPLLGKSDQGMKTFIFKGCKNWERVSFVHGSRCEGTALLRVGRGIIVLAAFDVAKDPLFKTDLERELALQNSGIIIRGVACGIKDGGECKTPHRGEGFINISLFNRFNDPVTVEGDLVIESPDGKKTFSKTETKDKYGAFNVRIDGDFLTFGETRVSVSITDKKSGMVFDLRQWTLDRPCYFNIATPEYRGLVSAARRDPTVHLGAYFDNGRNEIFEGRELTAVVTSPAGETVLDFKGRFADSNSVPFDVPLTHDAEEGVYKIVCESVGRDGEKVRAEDVFKIVPVRRGQVFVDQDGGLLADGEPWYPFGMYNLGENGEVDAASELGIDVVHVWKTSPEMIEHFKEKNMRLAVRTGAWKQVSDNWNAKSGIPPPVFDFETNVSFRAYADMIATEPETIAFWCTSNGGGINEVPGIRRISAYWNRIDPEDHPTYISTSHEPHMADAADILGVACHPRAFSHKDPMTAIADLIDKCYEANRPGRCIIAIPECFGNTSRRQDESPEECKCMAYLSIVHGVKGIFWYCWWDHEGQGAGKDPKIRKVIKEITTEAKEFKLALLAPGFSKFKSADKLVHGCLCGDDTTGRYLICINGAERPSDSFVELPLLKGVILEPLFDSPAVAPDANGKLSLKLNATERAVWRLTAR